jgi:hypothetical protein
MIYPNDANGDTLRRMEAQGDDLTRPRDIEFSVAFPDESSAEQFAAHFRALGHEVSVQAGEVDQDFPWDVIVVQHMAPSYDGVTNFETLLQSVAGTWGGTTTAGVVSPSRLPQRACSRMAREGPPDSAFWAGGLPLRR